MLILSLWLVKTTTVTATRPQAATRKPASVTHERRARPNATLLKTGLYHWIFDTTKVPKQVTLNKNLIEQALRDLARLCGMTIVSGPHAVEGIPQNPGFTAVCIVDFSHIGIHTFSNPCEVCVDIFSCKPFDPKVVHDYLLGAFRAKKEHSIFFDVRYPHEYDKKDMPFAHCVSEPKEFSRGK